ncbi:hypothetical protein JXR93_12815 [bacterium]|nr:hypothetical protein [bacterium]
MKTALFFISFILFAEGYLVDPQEIKYFPVTFYGEQESAQQEGTYSNIYPNYEERYILFDLNYFRMEPSVLQNEDSNPEYSHCVDWGDCYPSVKPLYYNLNLSRAARFHSNDMIVNGCFQHNSCDGTNIWERIQRYYSSSAMGENIAAGHGYENVTKNLINEVGATEGTDGHRINVFSSSFNEVGVGYLEGGTYRNYTTQDFGASASYHAIPVGIHIPKSPNSGASVQFKAIFHNSNSTTKPSEYYLSVNSSCHSLQEGVSHSDSAGGWYTGSYSKSVSLPSGCVSYSFQFKLGETIYKYPDVGSLLVGSSCDGIYTETEPVDCFAENPCSPNPCNEAHKTVCSIDGDSYVCSCDSGYSLESGVCVETTTDLCDPNPCTDEHKTVCSLSGDSYVCSCDSGYKLESGVCVEITNNVCLPNPCTEENRTKCTPSGETFICECNSGYYYDSETSGCVLDPCSSIICPQNSVCSRDLEECLCNSGYEMSGNSCVFVGTGGVASNSSSGFCSFSISGELSWLFFIPIVLTLYLRRKKEEIV